MKVLTRLERRALGLAKTGAAITLGCIPKDKSVPRYIADTLVADGFAAVIEERLRITHAGKKALNQPVPEDPDVFLKQLDGLTTSRDHALVAEGPVLDAATLKGFWKEQALRNKAETQDGRQHARQLKRATRNWPTRGPVGPVTTRFDPSVIRDADAA